LPTISATAILPSANPIQSNVHQLPPISTITVLSVPASHQITNNTMANTFITNTLKANNGSNNIAQLIANSANLSSTQNIQIINGTQLTSITPLTQINTITTPSILINNGNNNFNSSSANTNNTNNNNTINVEASNLFTVKDNSSILLGVTSNSNLAISSELSKSQQMIKVPAAQETQASSLPSSSSHSSSNSTGGADGLAAPDPSITLLPPAKRPRHSSISSSVSNSGSTYSNSSKQEAKSTMSLSENNEM
jgi:hypothetical protein